MVMSGISGNAISDHPISGEVLVDTEIAASTAALTLTTNPAIISRDVSVLSVTKALTLAGQQAAIEHPINVAATTQALTISGLTATITVAFNVVATTVTLMVTGQRATIIGQLVVKDGDLAFSTQFDEAINLAGTLDDSINLEGAF